MRREHRGFDVTTRQFTVEKIVAKAGTAATTRMPTSETKSFRTHVPFLKARKTFVLLA